MPNNTQIAEKLFYKSLGKGYTDNGDPFYSQDPSVDGFPRVKPEQIWTQEGDIPSASSFGAPDATGMSTYDGSISGVIQYKHNVQLISKPILGDKSFYSPDLRDVVPFNKDANGSYNYYITTQAGDHIAFGQGDWVVDIDQGLLTFYGTTPNGIDTSTPPRISFYRYIGNKGLKELYTDKIDTSTLKIDNYNGILEAIDGSIYTTTIESLKSQDERIIGDGTTSEFTVNHSLYTRQYDVTIYEVSTDEKVYTDVIRQYSNVTIKFNTPPANNKEYDIILMGY